jgi:chemotaxis-related protein WspB
MLMLLFYVSNECFALSCDSIVEVFPKVHLKKGQGMPNYIAGVMNYGGGPVFVIDTAQLIENRPAGSALHTRIVLISANLSGSNFLGLICEKAITTMEADLSQFVNPGFKFKDRPFLGGIYSQGLSSVQYFDAAELIKMLQGVLT